MLHQDNTPILRAALRDAAETALTAIAARAAHHARAGAPVDTGRLRDSITFAVEDSAAVIGTPVPYAPQVELDNRPFLRPALEDHLAEYRQILQDTLTQ